MSRATSLQPIPLTPEKNLMTDVENRSVYTLARCELNVFETYRAASLVSLTFTDTVITSMVRGKKVMHLPGQPQFDYFPGETVLAPAGTHMEIDFPEAESGNPTQCIALTLDDACVQEAVAFLNSYHPRVASGWHFNFSQAHVRNNPVLADIISKLVGICREGAVTKDALADLAMKELIVRLVQLQALHAADVASVGSTALSAVMEYIRKNLSAHLDVDFLSRYACMSRATFFRIFRREFGITPAQFIIRERVKLAREMLAATGMPVASVALECGFEDTNHFIRQFRAAEKVTPGAFKQLAHRR